MGGIAASIQLGQDEGTTCQRTRFTLNEENTSEYSQFSTDTNAAGRVRDNCGKGQEAYPEREEGVLRVSFPGAPTVTVTAVS